MKIKQIKSMFWGDSEHTVVGIIADTDEGDNVLIGTPYDETSIIWSDIKSFPLSQITEKLNQQVSEPPTVI